MFIEIPDRPVAKQRARTRGGQFYTPAATRHFEEKVAWIARAAGVSGISGDLCVDIEILTHRPLRGDVDNYAKSVLDGMVKGGLISDDREIVRLCISKGRAQSFEKDRTLVTLEWSDGPETDHSDTRSRRPA